MVYPILVIHLLLLLFVFLLPFHSLAKNNATIGVGSTLTATNTTKPWLSSPSGDFAFGFQQLQAGTNELMLCIWYAKLPEPTVVWHASTSGAAILGGSSVRVDADFGLILRDPQGNILWTPDGLIGVGGVDHGFLNDTGKFVLLGSDSKVVWDTFAHPTDTLLPTQAMEIDKMLISRRSEANFSQGRFYLRILETGDLVLSTKSFSTNSDFENDYYNTHTSDDPTNSDGYKLMFSEWGSLYTFETSNKTTVEITPPLSVYSEDYLRVTLNFDGVLSLYRIPKNSTGNQTWISTWSQPENICNAFRGNHGSGVCGYNSMCSIDANTKRPNCKCPPGFSLLHPSDEYGSCKPNYVQTCDENWKGSYEIIEMPNTDWPNNDIENIDPCSKDECKIACLNDCFCDAAIHQLGSCWKKRMPLSNGLTDNSILFTGLLKIRKNATVPPHPYTPPHTPSREFPGKNKDLAVSVLLGTSVFINFILIATACFGFFYIYKRKTKKLNPTNPQLQSNLHCYLYKQLEEATNGFREEIGRGASAIVYKGEMPVGSGNIVAVKKLDRVAQDSEKEFKAEVNVIGQTHHKHLVRLLGYCNEAQHHLLVYEYMSNGTLANFLFSNVRPSWSQRTKIALGIAHGLTYLHEECSTQIIHCDIKPQNILVDDYYNPRISDFGLAKLLRVNESRTHTNIRGTKGYVAPEWFNENEVTAKVDVYSFGKLLVEIITCQRSVKNTLECESDEVVLVHWVTDCFQENRLDLLVENDAEALNDMEKVNRFVMTAIWCIQNDPSLRPTMRKVCQMLEGVIEVPVPPYPYISV